MQFCTQNFHSHSYSFLSSFLFPFLFSLSFYFPFNFHSYSDICFHSRFHFLFLPLLYFPLPFSFPFLFFFSFCLNQDFPLNHRLQIQDFIVWLFSIFLSFMFLCHMFLYVFWFWEQFPTSCTSNATATMLLFAVLLQATPSRKIFSTPCTYLIHTLLLGSWMPLSCSFRQASVLNCFPHRAHSWLPPCPVIHVLQQHALVCVPVSEHSPTARPSRSIAHTSISISIPWPTCIWIPRWSLFSVLLPPSPQ